MVQCECEGRPLQGGDREGRRSRSEEFPGSASPVPARRPIPSSGPDRGDGGVTADWLLRGDRPVAITLARDPAWGEAVAWLRQAWRDPGRRETVVGVLNALAAPPRSAGPR